MGGFIKKMQVLNGLREWQADALRQWIDRGHRGIAEVATAGGKTRFALACICEWMTSPEDHVIILVPTIALQDQWVVALQDDLGINRSEISVWKEDRDVTRRFHVMVINTARTEIDSLVSPGFRYLLIADECHRYASPSNSLALSFPADATIGLTATAEREFDNGLDEILVPKLGPVFFKYSVSDAARDGIISPFELVNVRVPLTFSESAAIARLTKSLGIALRNGDVDRAKLVALRRASVSKNAVARIPAAIQLFERHTMDRVLIFHEEIKSAEKIATDLRFRGYPAVTYHSKMSADLRRDNLRLFRKGQSPVLVCCRALDEGIDVPEVNVAIVAAATTSQRQRIQRLGRALRKSSNKEMATIYTIYATDEEGVRLAVEAKRLMEIASTRWFEISRQGHHENS